MPDPQPMPPQLRDELAKMGRLCALFNIQLTQGTVPIAVEHSLEDMRRVIDRLIPILRQGDPRVWVQLNVRLGENTAQLLAEALNPQVPDSPEGL